MAYEARPTPLTTPLAAPSVPELPVWPIALLLAGFPVLWVLGLGAFAVALCAVPMLALLWTRRHVAAPIGFGIWALFVIWVVIAALRIDDPLRLVGYGVRLSNYVGVTVLFLYVYNMSERRLPTRAALQLVSAFFAFVVVGGWLGVLVPDAGITTPVARVLPSSIMANEYVASLVQPRFAEVQRPYGSPVSYARPSAPFPYTNGWGVNVALLVPMMLAAASGASRRTKLLIGLLLVAALVPAAATLNRGLYVAVGVAVGYAALRLAGRGRLAPLAWLVLAAAAGGWFAVASGVWASLTQRLEYSESSEDRLLIYQEALQGTLDSPLLGNGAPRPSETLDVSVGTQGHFWNVMFSFGFPGLLFFLGFLVWVACVSRSWRTPVDLWLHVTLVIAVLTVFYYGYDGPQLALVLVAAALVLRRVRPPAASSEGVPGSPGGRTTA